MGRRAVWLGTALALALIAAAPPARAQQTLTVNALDFVRAAMATGNNALARETLDALHAHDPDDVETNFLLATLDASEGALPSAIAGYRAILRDHPDRVRVRLDYAVALFRSGEDDNADYNFRLALEADLPDAARDQVMAYLRAIRARRRYSGSVAVSVAPDTNINAGTTRSEITLFGLPFTPSEQIKRKSGVGATVALGGEYRYPLSDTLRWRSNATVWRAEYPGARFDDMIFRTTVGPEFLSQDWDLSALAVYTQRWYGNDPFDSGAGPRVEATYHGFERWRIEGDAEEVRLGFHSQSFQDGDYISANLYPSYALPPAAFLRPIIGYFRQLTQSAAFANTGYRIGLGFHQEFSHGITGELQGEMFFSYYDGPNVLFGTTRRDQTLRVRASVYRRDWIIFGFNPVLSVVFTRNASNQDLFGYRREQAEVGFTKEF